MRPVNTEKAINAKEIVSKLDYLPLGIVTAARSIETNGWSHKEYVDIYNPAEVTQVSKPFKSPVYRYSYSPDAVWNIELKRLRENPGLWGLLHTLAFFDPDRIHEDILSQTEGPNRRLLYKSQHLQSEVQFVRIRAKLTRSVLITRIEKPNDNQFRVHRLSQQKCHLGMTSNAR